MSANNTTLHVLASVGTVLVGSSLLSLLVYASRPAQAAPEPPLKELVTIEASLARKSVKQKQPVKELKTPEPPAKPEGVSRDENKPPEPKKDDKKPAKKPEDKTDISKYLRPSDDEPQSGAKPTTDIGQFDGSEKGFAPLNAGDPYWRNLAADFRQLWEIPAVLKVSGTPVGCFHIAPDGKIVDTKFDVPSGDETLDDSVQRALQAIKKVRNEKPQPVPVGQLGAIKGWTCFRFTP